MHEERKVRRRIEEVIDPHDAGEHEHSLSLDERVAVVEPGDVEEGPRRDEGDDLMEVDRRQLPMPLGSAMGSATFPAYKVASSRSGKHSTQP